MRNLKPKKSWLMSAVFGILCGCLAEISLAGMNTPQDLRVEPVARANTPSAICLANPSAIRAYAAWSENSPTPVGRLFVKEFNGISWELVGMPPLINMDPNHDAGFPSITAGFPNLVYVSWCEDNGSGTKILFVKRFPGTGNLWEPMGGSLNYALTVRESSIQAKNSSLMVAFSELNNARNTYQIYLKKWNSGGMSWDNIPVPPSPAPTPVSANRESGTNAYSPCLAINSTNAPYVAWQEGNNVFVSWCSNTEWLPLGNAINDTSPAQNPSLALDASERPMVAWQEGIPSKIFVKRWNANASAWEAMGSQINIEPNADKPCLSVSPNGQPFITWSEIIGGKMQIRVKTWVSPFWELIGSPILIENKNACYPQLAADMNDLYLAWDDEGPEVKEWHPYGGWWDLRTPTPTATPTVTPVVSSTPTFTASPTSVIELTATPTLAAGSIAGTTAATITAVSTTT